MGASGTNKTGRDDTHAQASSRNNAIEVRRLQARVRRLEQTIKQLEAALPAIDLRDRPLDLQWAGETSDSPRAQPAKPNSFAEAWDGGAAPDDAETGGTFFEMEFAEERARRWFLRGA